MTIKNFSSVFLLASALLSAVSCSKENGNENTEPTEGPVIVNESSSAINGEIIIKLKKSGSERVQTKSVIKGRSGIEDLDKVLENAGTVRFERLFPDGRFAERTHKEGLDSWYYAEYDDKITAKEMAKMLSQCNDIDVIEYSLEAASPSSETMVNPITLSQNSISDNIRETPFPFNESVRSQNLQWHYNNTGKVFAKETMQGADANVYAAWTLCTGNPDVIVAVVDQGVKYDHEDLADNMWINEAELNGTPGKDDDGNGYIDDIYGYNFTSNSGSLSFSEEMSHGTHVAGTVAAVNNNGKGVCGVAGGSGKHDGVRIMSCEILAKSESGSSGAGLSGQIRAIKYAADNGAVICQNSWGYTAGALSATDWSKGSYSALSKAIDYFNKYAGLDENGNQVGPMAGGLVLFAAGNDASQELCYPASSKNVVSVTATNFLGNASYFTNYGTWVSLAAPGGDQSLSGSYGGIYSTGVSEDGGSGYVGMQGTSMACPHVSGACALAVSYYYGAEKKKGLTGEILKEALLSSTKPVDPYCGSEYVGKMGIGSLDTYKLLLAVKHIEEIGDQTIGVGSSTVIDLSKYFLSTSVIVYSVEDQYNCIEVSLNDGKMTIKGKSSGTATVIVSDGMATKKSILVTVK